MLTKQDLSVVNANPGAARQGETTEMLLARLAAGRVVKEIRLLSADETFTFEPGFLYSVAAVKEGASLNLVDETTTGIYEGVAVEFLTSDVFVSVTAGSSGGQVQIVIY